MRLIHHSYRFIAVNSIKKSHEGSLLRFISLYSFILVALLISTAFANETLTINIEGISNPLLENAESRLMVEKNVYGTSMTARDIQAFFSEAPSQIKEALQPYGYFKPIIHAKLKHKASEWKTTFQIEKGSAVRIQHIDLVLDGAGKEDPALKPLIERFLSLKGKVWSTNEYNTEKDALFEAIQLSGYLKAFFEKKEVRIDIEHDTASLIIHINTGSRYYFGHFYFSNSPYSSSFLKRFISLHEGAPFSSPQLLTLQQELSHSRYFKSVIVEPLFDEEKNNAVPVRIDISVPKSQQYNIGLGYGTFTGPRLTMGMDFRRVGDEGERFSAQMKLSSVLSGLAATYYIPGANPLTDQYTLGMNIQHFLPKNGSSLSETLSASYLKSINPWRHTLSLNLLNDAYRENDSPKHTSHLLYPAYTISRLSVDDMMNPRRGSSISLTLQGANKDLGSTTDFFQTEIKNKFIVSPTLDSRFIFSTHLGYTIVKNLDQLPLTMNFFAGGMNSVRGYPFDSLGPGRYVKTASIEFQQKVVGNWSGATFYDLGNASDHFNDSLKRGDGVGIIYRSIIGPIKFYVARAESKKDKPLSIEFSIGPEF